MPRALDEGSSTYVIMPDGSVRAFEDTEVEGNGIGAGHLSLAEGGPVRGAGKLRVDSNEDVVEFDNYSGHYAPRGKELEGVARQASQSNEFDVSKARWDRARSYGAGELNSSMISWFCLRSSCATSSRCWIYASVNAAAS